MEYRRATVSDLESEWAVFTAAVVELRTRRGNPFSPPRFDPSGAWAEVHRHLLAHDGERCFVAELDGQVVGFTAAFVRGDVWFFAALFIDPGHQGLGIGRELLDRAWGDSYARRLTITEAIQPISNGLYSRRGLLPVTPVLAFVGSPSIDSEPGTLERAVPTPEALLAIDQAAYGFDRATDHDFWQRSSDRSTLWVRDGQPCAYSYRGGFAGNIGPVAGIDPQSAAAALRAELAESGGGDVRVDIPGTATALVDTAVRSGLRFADPGLLLLSPPDSPPTAYAIHSYWML